MSSNRSGQAGRTTAPTESGRVPCCAQRLVHRLQRIWSAYWQHQACRAAVLALPMLDDRTLEDIGFTRSEVDAVLFGSRAERRRSYDACWRAIARSHDRNRDPTLRRARSNRRRADT